MNRSIASLGPDPRRQLGLALDDPTGVLIVGVETLLELIPPAMLERLFAQQFGKNSSILLRSLKTALDGSPTLGKFADHASSSYQEGRVRGQRQHVRRLIRAYTMRRPVAALSKPEAALLRGMAALHLEGEISDAEWTRFFARLVWADGACLLALPPDLAGDSYEPTARKFLSGLLGEWLHAYDRFLEDSLRFLAERQYGSGETSRLIRELLHSGARWKDDADLEADGSLAGGREAGSLLIGYGEQSGAPVFYTGNESLITIAGPGTGKSQAQVIPNLLRYPGSAIVLDIKGELWRATAAHRAARYGRVLRFSPSDPDGASHCYNPLDYISRDPRRAATECDALSAQIIPPENDESKDKYWTMRAKDLIWAFACLVALEAMPHERNLAQIMEHLAVPTKFKDLDSQEFLKSQTFVVLRQLDRAATKYDLPALRHTAEAIRSGLAGEERLESIFDTARSYLSVFARASLLRAATARSDWRPLDLRGETGMTVYICLSGGDVQAYTPLIRVLLQQHADLLLRDFSHAPGTPPITFFLDEMPQLGYIPTLQHMLDVGRGAGLRLWLFAQYLGQLNGLYRSSASGLVNSCRLRCFMHPDNDAVEFLKPQLGLKNNLLSGEKEELAESAELMGQAYGDKIIVTERGARPMRLDKRYAWETHASAIGQPPPEVPQPMGGRE